jgi:hypothetical protein
VVVDVGGQVLLYRRRHGHTYFRLVVPCAVCGRTAVTWRGARIASAKDLASAKPPPLMCNSCLEKCVAAQSPTESFSSKLERRLGPGQAAS